VKKTIALALVCAMTLFGFACAEQAADASSMDIILSENPTTGYTWSVAVNDGDVLAVIDNDYTADAATEGLAGGGGTHSWTVTGVGKGEASVYFKLNAPDGSTEATVGYTFSVDKQSALTMTAIIGVPETYMTDYGVVSLKENPTTGYEWTYELSADGILTPERDIYSPDSTGDEALVGAGGVHLWTFKGTAAGDVTLTFSYARSWEEGTQPEATVVFNCHVDDALNVTLSTTSEDFAQYNPDATEDAAQ